MAHRPGRGRAWAGLRDQGRTVLADPAAGGDILLDDGGGLPGGGGRSSGRGQWPDGACHPVQGPGEVDGRRPRGREARHGGGQCGVRRVGPEAQSQPPGRRRPDEGCAAHLHGGDGPGGPL